MRDTFECLTLTGGTVEKEVHTVVNVHEHLCYGPRQFDVGDNPQVSSVGIPEGCTCTQRTKNGAESVTFAAIPQ